MAAVQRDAEFTEYVNARAIWLRRTAYLLCQDWHRADDLTQAALLRLYLNWERARDVEHLDAYARTILVNIYLNEQRSSWWKRIRLAQPALPPEPQAPNPGDTEGSLDLLAALAALPPRQRAALVLRYYCDLSIADTAQLLGCTTGTIKSQTSRGLDTLRHILGAHPAV